MSRKPYILIGVISALFIGSYALFISYSPKSLTEVARVKGYKTDSEFVIPYPNGSKELSVDTTLGGKQITLQSIKSQKEIESFYNNVFIIRGWQVESSGLNNGFLVNVYKKGNQKINVSISQTKNLEETIVVIDEAL